MLTKSYNQSLIWTRLTRSSTILLFLLNCEILCLCISLSDASALIAPYFRLKGSRCYDVSFRYHTTFGLWDRTQLNLLKIDRQKRKHFKKSRISGLNSCVEAPVDLKYIEFPMDEDTSIEEQHEPVILLHGLLGQKRNFSTFGDSLATLLQKKRRIIALDLRNHGDNYHDWRMEMTHNHMARDVLALMDNLNISTAVVIGHSMGGKIGGCSWFSFLLNMLQHISYYSPRILLIFSYSNLGQQ